MCPASAGSRCFPGLGGPGGGGLVSGTGVRESVTILALPEQVRVARAFVAGMLGPSHGYADVAMLLASELVTNSVRHSGSAGAGETVTVAVRAWDSTVRVEVTDRSGPGCRSFALPAGMRKAAADCSSSRGSRRGGDGGGGAAGGR